MRALFLFFGVFIFIVFVVCAIVYVLNGIGTMYVLKSLGFMYPWMAWVPFGRMIALGLCIGDIKDSTDMFGIVKMPNIVLVLYSIIAVMIGWCVPVIGRLLCFAVSLICGGMVFSIIYSKMEGTEVSDNYVAGYLSGLIGVVSTVKFLMYRLKGRVPE